MRTLEAISLSLLLISSSGFLVHSNPAPESAQLEYQDNITFSDAVDSTKIPTTTPVTTASSTVAPPTTTVSHDNKGKERVASTEAEENPSSESKRVKKPKEKSAKLLLYEVEKSIRNLSLEAIEYVLGLGDEVFSFGLADVLGYLKGGQEDDNEPHIKVMDENKQVLIKILEERKMELKPVVKVPPPTTKPVTSLPPSETPPPPPPPNEHRIEYAIVKKIRKLTIEDIDQLINTFAEQTLPYALGVQLGYDDERDVEYFRFLDAQGGEKLKRVLENEERKLAEPHPKPSQDTRLQSNGDDAKELSSNRPPDGGGGETAELLLYEVEVGIRNLYLEAVEYVLGLGDEAFSFGLADALGYLKGGQEDDTEPHRKVMDKNKQALTKILKERKQALKPVVKVPPPTTKPVTSPPPSETPPPPNESRIKYAIVKKIRELTIEDIDHLIDTYDVNTLPYALGDELGYDDERDKEYFRYLDMQGGEKLKRILMKEKERKLAEPRPKPSQDTQPQSNGDDAKELGSNRPPDGGGGKTVEEVNWGSKEREKVVVGGDRLPSPQVTSGGRKEDGGMDENHNRPLLSHVGYEHVDSDVWGGNDIMFNDGGNNDRTDNSLTSVEPTHKPSNKGTRVSLLAKLNEPNLDEDTKALLIEMIDRGERDLGKIDDEVAIDLMREYLKYLKATKYEGENREIQKDYDKENKDELEKELEETQVQPSEESEREGEVHIAGGSEAEISDEGTSLGGEDKGDDQESLGDVISEALNLRTILFIFIGVAIIAGCVCQDRKIKLRRSVSVYHSNKYWRRHEPLASTSTKSRNMSAAF